jgi:hypothetical protein
MKASSSSVTKKDITWLWVNMTEAFGNRFITNFGEKDHGVWLHALSDLTRDDLQYGFNKALKTFTKEEREKGVSWPPNVKEFRMHCERRLKDFGLPEAHAAFEEAKTNSYLSRHVWTHPLVCLTYKKLDRKAEDFIADTDYAAFTKIYAELCQHFMRGEAMQVPAHYKQKGK